MAFFLLYDAIFQTFKKTRITSFLFYFLLGIILIIGILDQTPNGIAWNKSLEAKYKQDAQFIHEIEALMPKNAMIFQMPYVPFPEWPPVNKMTDYDHLRAYLHSKTLRWSYGAMKGREAVIWQRIVTAKPVNEFLENLSSKGFSGVYLDRFGYQDTGAELEAKLSALLNTKPLISPDRRLVFFDMTEYNKRTKKINLSLTDEDLELPLRDISLPKETNNLEVDLDFLKE